MQPEIHRNITLVRHLYTNKQQQSDISFHGLVMSWYCGSVMHLPVSTVIGVSLLQHHFTNWTLLACRRLLFFFFYLQQKCF